MGIFYSIRLVLIRGSETVGDSCDRNLLDLMFASLVLLLGLDTLTSATNVERLKKDIKVGYYHRTVSRLYYR